MIPSWKLPLSPDQFRDALQKGFGRAFVHIRRFGAAGLQDDILHACLHSLVHDPQFEGTRGEWLFLLLRRSGDLDFYGGHILNALRNATPESVPYWDFCQLMSLASVFANAGNREAYRLIYEKFDQQLYEPAAGGYQILALDGLVGLIHLAEVLGARLRSEADFRDDGFLLLVADQEYGEDKVTELLEERADGSRNVAAFLRAVRAKREERKSSQPARRPLSLHEFLDAVENGDELDAMDCWRFGRSASTEDLHEIFRRLLSESCSDRLVSYLRVFSSQRLPRLHDRIFQFAQSQNEQIRFAAITALAQVKALEVRQLGLTLLAAKDPVRCHEAVRLLSRNSTSREVPRIVEALPREGPPDALHGIASTVGMLTALKRLPGDEELLNWVYEYNPCSFCRHSAFRKLAKRNALTKAQLAECVWDSYDDTRRAARRLLRNRRAE